jgi:hypothetical protein
MALRLPDNEPDFTYPCYTSARTTDERQNPSYKRLYALCLWDVFS